MAAGLLILSVIVIILAILRSGHDEPESGSKWVNDRGILLTVIGTKKSTEDYGLEILCDINGREVWMSEDDFHEEYRPWAPIS